SRSAPGSSADCSCEAGHSALSRSIAARLWRTGCSPESLHNETSCTRAHSRTEIAECFARRYSVIHISHRCSLATGSDRCYPAADQCSERRSTRVPGRRCGASSQGVFHSDLLRRITFEPAQARPESQETKRPQPLVRVRTPKEVLTDDR